MFRPYLCSGTCVSEMTMFWSIRMSNARSKPRPMALSVFIPVSFSNGGKVKIGPSWTLNTGTNRKITTQTTHCKSVKSKTYNDKRDA